MGNKIALNSHQQERKVTSERPVNLVHNKLSTATAYNSHVTRPHLSWFDRQEYTNDNKHCNIFLQQLEQTVQCQQQLQHLAINFQSKYDDDVINSDHVVPGGRPNHPSSSDKTSFSPLQYVKRKFSLKKQDKENDRVLHLVVASSSPPPVSSSSPPPVSSSSPPPVSSSARKPPSFPSLPPPPPSSSSSSSSSSFHDSELTTERYVNQLTKTSYGGAFFSDKNNNYFNNNTSNHTYNDTSNHTCNDNNMDIIDSYLCSSTMPPTNVPANNYSESSPSTPLTGNQFKLTTDSHDANLAGGAMHLDSICGNGNPSVDECQGRTKKGEVVERNDAVENQWSIKNFPVASSPGLKVKKKIRTNPWIAHSSVATPPSSPDISHLSTPGGNTAMEKQLLKQKYSFVGCDDDSYNDRKFLGPNRSPLIDGMTRHDDDLNSCSEGYYSSSFGSLSGYSVESPGLSPLKMKRLIPESNDSGFFSMMNSCNSYFGGTVDLGPTHDGESSDDSLEGDHVTKETRHPSIDDEIMPLPCSRDLIAINQLLRRNQIQKHQETMASSHVIKSLEECKDDDDDDDDDDVEDALIAREDSMKKNGQQSLDKSSHPKLQRKISFEIENQIFELKHSLYGDVFEEAECQLVMEQPIIFQRDQQHRHIRAHDFVSSSSDDSTRIDDVIQDDGRTLEEIRSSLETSYRELLRQGRNVREEFDRRREMEESKREKLKVMREISIENKKQFLIQTLQRLKVCLDQQQTWLQRTYDIILEMKWPSLHQVKG